MQPVIIRIELAPYQGKPPFSKFTGAAPPLRGELGKKGGNDGLRQRWFEAQLLEFSRALNSPRIPWAFQLPDGRKLTLDKGCVQWAMNNGFLVDEPAGRRLDEVVLTERAMSGLRASSGDAEAKSRQILAHVRAEHILQAAEWIAGQSEEAVKARAGTSRWARTDYVNVNGNRYPLKITLEIAYQIATGGPVPESVEANTRTYVRVLRQLGFSPWTSADQELDDAEREAEEEGAFNANDETDARWKVTRAIVQRRGARKFRNALLKAYKGECAITGCGLEDVLEAAHIEPYRGPQTNHVTNGLLLRADVHTLFDLDLIAVHPKTQQVLLSFRLKGSQYERELSGIVLRAPAAGSLAPDATALAKRHRRFVEREKQVR